jgi:site-specific recombinase XerD
MGQRVVLVSDGHRVQGCGPDGEFVNRFLAHLESRAFSSATVRAYAYDLLNFLRFLAGREARLADVVATDLFDYLDWQQRPTGTAGQAGQARRRVRPHRLRHTYGTELASAAIDLLALRELMGHVNPKTTAAYVHLSPETLAWPDAGVKT